MASPQYSFLSSSGVKELATFGGRIDDLVPDEVARRLQEELTTLTKMRMREKMSNPIGGPCGRTARGGGH